MEVSGKGEVRRNTWVIRAWTEDRAAGSSLCNFATALVLEERRMFTSLTCVIVDHLQGSIGPFGLKSEKISKGVSGALRPRVTRSQLKTELKTWNESAVPKRGRSKCGRTKHPNEHKRSQTKVRKRAQKSAKGRVGCWKVQVERWWYYPGGHLQKAKLSESASPTQGAEASGVKQASPSYWPPAVDSSIAVEDAVENRGLYRVFVSRLFQRGFRHHSTTIVRLSPPSGLERGGWGLPPLLGCESQSRSPSQRGSYSCRGGEAEIV